MVENTPPNPVKRHPEYYFHDGSVIILVEDTLFKVHRSMLVKDSSIFGSMFSLPPPESNGKQFEGQSDDNPLVLQGETAVRFERLLWSLYALPCDFGPLYKPQGDLNLIIDIASVSHKYNFQRLETWAANLLTTKIQRKQYPSNIDFLPILDYAILTIDPRFETS
ncbi:hypothetical protein BOTBODRAFT_171570 [Botryobasidium botryosum FD-172 SS1]|uniref:BTB domain-containing protein n=1 Tax=Botryobasidium botryosum (strain FD-172 SS1) TaxID=930990 RepID=A0A067N290_BOTB1|nr:hypothetical protein BOTBODRAFT_171570 [Botryobasidium botryosum FD-172 SS1]